MALGSAGAPPAQSGALAGLFEGAGLPRQSAATAGGIGGLLAWRHNPSGQTAYYHSDGNGNVTMLVNPQQIPVAKYTYDPFGNTLAMSGPLAEANTLRFSSKEIHPATGLYHFGERFYSPNLQRWLNPDPAGFVDGPNLYAYVGNGPTYAFDPWGEFTLADIGVIHAIVAIQLRQLSPALIRIPPFVVNPVVTRPPVTPPTTVNPTPGPWALIGGIFFASTTTCCQGADYSDLDLRTGILGEGQYIGPDGQIWDKNGPIPDQVNPLNPINYPDSQNIATIQWLADQLALASANSPFTPEGRLTEDTINNSVMIIPASQLTNPQIQPDFSKYTTPTYQSPSGDFQVHFYYNPTTGQTDYTLDYKVVFNQPLGNRP